MLRGLAAAGFSSVVLPTITLAKSLDGVLELRAAKAKYSPAGDQHAASDVWLYNGKSPGPEIRVRQGERLKVHFINDLDEPTTVHWHGIRIDNAMDGVPGLTQRAVMPGESFHYDFTVPDAGTFWYHAHTKNFEQVARGLYGALIVEGDGDDIPEDRDITLVLDDWWLNKDGSFVDGFENYLLGKQGGRIGNVFTVNGEPLGETFNLDAGQPYRLRLINAANARVFHLDVSELDPQLIALDGQPLVTPVGQVKTLAVAPAQRTDLLFVPRFGREVAIRDAQGVLGTTQDDGRGVALVEFSSSSSSVPPASSPGLLPSSLAEPDISSAITVPLVMKGGSLSSIETAIYRGKRLGKTELAQVQQVWTFNGTANLPETPLFRVKRGQSVVVDMKNMTGWAHAMHVHGHHFRVIEGATGRPENAWHDTVLVDRMQDVMLVFVADNPGKWLLHCHMLQHAVAGMRTWFEVL